MRTLGWLTTSTLALSVLSAWAAADRPRPTPANWLGDYTRAKTVARQSGKPIFVTFH